MVIQSRRHVAARQFKCCSSAEALASRRGAAWREAVKRMPGHPARASCTAGIDLPIMVRISLYTVEFESGKQS